MTEPIRAVDTVVVATDVRPVAFPPDTIESGWINDLQDVLEVALPKVMAVLLLVSGLVPMLRGQTLSEIHISLVSIAAGYLFRGVLPGQRRG
jgi:hypothetical protein